MTEISIQGVPIGVNHPPYIVAELSGNHNQSLERALALISAAADAGANAIKLQTYTADTLTIDSQASDFMIKDPNSPWYGNNLYQLYHEAHTPWEWHKELFEHARKLGIAIFSTPFDKTAVDFLEELDAPCYKIASFECVDISLIEYAAAKMKPMILSTGMATLSEIDAAVTAIRRQGNDQIVLLKCTSTYPASPVNSNIATIPNMQSVFDCQIGLSDHCLTNAVAVASVALGVRFIEKHFTLRRDEGGVDSTFSLEPHELRQLASDSKDAWRSIGRINYGPVSDESASVQFRRSLYVVEDMSAGDVLTPSNTRIIRPGYGLPPSEFDKVLGIKVTSDVPAGTPLSWSLLK